MKVQQIRWEISRYGSIRGLVKVSGRAVEIATLASSTRRGDSTWNLRLSLPGVPMSITVESQEAGQQAAQQELNLWAESITTTG